MRTLNKASGLIWCGSIFGQGLWELDICQYLDKDSRDATGNTKGGQQ